MKNKSVKIIIYFLVLSLALVLRLYKIQSPLADHHSWRQADSASVIRNLAFNKFDILRPAWDNMVASNSKNLPNPNRYFFEDFPLSFDVYPAIFYKIFGSSVEVLRLSSVVFSLLSILFLGLLVNEFTGFWVGVFSAFVYAVLPFSIFFSRGVFQENPLNLYSILALFCLVRFLKKGKPVNFFLSILFNSLLFLTKPYALCFLLPEVFLFLQSWKLKSFKKVKFYSYFIFSLLPFVLWWVWALRFPEGMPFSSWLLNEGNIRFKGAFFHWIFAERIGKLILGNYGLIFFGLGLVILGKGDGFFYFWLISLLVYVSVIAKGNVTHDYYQIPLIPIFCIFLAKGTDWLIFEKKELFNRAVCCLLFAVCSIFLFAFGWYEVRGFYNIQSGVDLAGEAVDQLTSKDSLVTTGDSNDATLLYNTNRWGWSAGYASEYPNSKETIERLKEKGASYYVTTKFDQNSEFGKYMIENYFLLKQSDQYIIFKLTD